MSKLKPCPFCGKALSLFGNDVRNGKLVEVFIHPYEVDDGWDRCPLTSLVFDLERWQLRPIEDELRAELEKRTAGLHYANAVCMEMKHELDRLKEENHALDQINRDIQTAAAHLDEVLAELARRDEIIRKLKEDGERLFSGLKDFDGTRGWKICKFCHAEMEFVDHSPDCPITLHRALMKGLE